MYHCSFPLLFLCRLIFLLDSLHGAKLMETYNTTDKDLPQDIHILNLRTLIRVSIITILFLKVIIFNILLQDSQEPPSPSGETVLVLHRQGFTACYPPWGMRGVTNGGKVKKNNGKH